MQRVLGGHEDLEAPRGSQRGSQQPRGLRIGRCEPAGARASRVSEGPGREGAGPLALGLPRVASSRQRLLVVRLRLGLERRVP
jgi:hypothetical protein